MIQVIEEFLNELDKGIFENMLLDPELFVGFPLCILSIIVQKVVICLFKIYYTDDIFYGIAIAVLFYPITYFLLTLPLRLTVWTSKYIFKLEE